MLSIIIISHNYGRYLQQCIDSVLKNNKKLVNEIIILNDSSTDDTEQISKKNIIKNKKIKYYKVNFYSLSKSYNYAIKKAVSEWITKIDADDYIKPFFLKNYFNYILKKKLDYVYGDLIIKEELRNKKYVKIQKVNKIFTLIKYPVGSGCIFKKKIWKKVGGFNEDIFYQDDYDFWLKINKKNFKIGYLNQAGYVYRKHQKNMSKNILRKNFTKIKIFLLNLFK